MYKQTIKNRVINNGIVKDFIGCFALAILGYILTVLVFCL